MRCVFEMDPILLIPLLVAFAVTFILTPIWIRAAIRIGHVGKDMNKFDRPPVAEMGGLPINGGFIAGILVYIGITTFILEDSGQLLYVMAALSTLLIMMLIGLIDDILGWKIGLRQWQKPILTMLAALPMMAVNAGNSSFVLPYFGSVDIGILFPLLIIPLGITGAANGFNMLAGFNGLEAGMGIIILSTLGYGAFITGNGYVALISLTMVFSLIAFMKFNWYPSKIFPGDTMTYSVGAMVAVIAIMGNMEKLALLLFIPYFVDFFLPLRKRLKVEAFGKPNPDNSLEMPYDKIYDSGHLAIFLLKKVKEKVYEREVTLLILSFEAFLALIGIIWVL